METVNSVAMVQRHRLTLDYPGYSIVPFGTRGSERDRLLMRLTIYYVINVPLKNDFALLFAREMLAIGPIG